MTTKADISSALTAVKAVKTDYNAATHSNMPSGTTNMRLTMMIRWLTKMYEDF